MANLIIPRGATAINNQLIPSEGPRALPLQIDFQSDASRIVDLRDAVYRKQIAGVQSISWVNTMAEPVYINPESEIGTAIVLPPKSCGTVPIILTEPERFSASIDAAGNGKFVRITLLNVPMPAEVWGIMSADADDLYVADLVDGPGAPGAHGGKIVRVSQDGTQLVYETAAYDVSATVYGAPAAGQLMLLHCAARGLKMLSSLEGSYRAYAAEATTAEYVCDIKVNGTTRGTVTFPATANVGVIDIPANINIAAGDVITITAPASLDLTIGDITFTLVFERA